MQVFEFEVDAVNDIVRIPPEYMGLFNKHIKFIAMVNDSLAHGIPPVAAPPPLTDEYIKNNWRELVKTGLVGYDKNYYNSDQYKEDRGAFLMEKYK